ncbi:KRAB-A domain-containing protein 2-like [Diadema setosum]|uniref:KRAB-A domain-containing protein 2-like n=1 Tax=Diadema setosum TaxID=31175 RepID=UPI003B3AC2BC
MMCASTRFPEAVPLRRIQNVSKALVKFFTTVGLPKVVQSDQGSNFTSKIFQQVMRELGIKCVTSSAYHPQSQGALERFHQTLKNMMRTYCFEVEKDWDEGLPLLLFSVRESVQES